MTNDVKKPARVFKIEHLFGSKTRVRLLTLFLDNPERSFYVRELTRRIDAQLNSVRRELKNLVDVGIVLEVEGKIIDREKDIDEENAPGEQKLVKKKYYKADTEFPFYHELRNIMKKAAVMMNRDFVKEVQSNGKIVLLFLTGRFIDNKQVPSDILVVGEIPAKRLQLAIENFEKQIGREINYTYMPTEEFTYRKEVKDKFLYSLINTDKVVLINTLSEEI